MTDTTQLIAALNRQQQLLEMILGAMEKPKLGLHSDAGTVFIYCNRQHGCLWYTLDGDRNPQPITHTAITGYLRQLKFELVERRGKECHKLLTTIEADRLYCLESGHDSHFSKGLLASVATLTPACLMQPITIQPQPGDDASVLFCRVWCGTQIVKVSYDESVNWREISKAAIAVVKAAVVTEIPRAQSK